MKNLVIVVFAFVLCVPSGIMAQYSGGSGTLGLPYRISSVTDLAALATAVNSGATQSGIYFQQTADLDLNVSPYNSGSGWPCIGNGSTSFSGVYDGNNKKISNLYISNETSTSGIGLFAGYLGGTIKNLGIINPSVRSTTQNAVAALTGWALSGALVQNCYVSGGSVQGYDYTAAVCGNASASSQITQCYASGVIISGHSMVGGIAGYSFNANINNCYSSCSVSAVTQGAGGVVGSLQGTTTLTNCYGSCSTVTSQASYGGVAGEKGGGATITACFYDNTIYTTNNNCGTGKSTLLMKTQSTFTSVSWDFTTTPIWEMVGTSYPRLKANAESALPVELISFSAITNASVATLHWNTATEVNNYGFEIERKQSSLVSARDEDWSKIGFVEGNGTTNAPKSYSFVDNSASGKTSYRLKQIDRDGKFEYSQTVEVNVASAPKEFALLQNHPNPFNPSTSIQYQIAAPGHVSLKVYDMVGREVATLVNGMQDAGVKNVQFDASHMPSGIYFYTLQTSSFTTTKKMSLIK